jgi:hypothetical protein
MMVDETAAVRTTHAFDLAHKSRHGSIPFGLQPGPPDSLP